MDIEQFLITPENLDQYLTKFQNYEQKSELANRDFWKDKKILVTGISGFVGSHLVEKLLEYGSDVHGLVRRHAVPHYPHLAKYEGKITLREGNLTDINSLRSVITDVEPQVIFHFGAQSFVPTSFRVPIETYMVNIMGTANLLETCRNHGNLEAIHIAGSSEEYGKVAPEHIPITEQAPLCPMSPYGISKVATDKLGVGYHEMYGLPTVITRAFNHSGPRRGLQFVTSVIARQIARCLIRGTRDITIGKPDSIRDISYVGDIIQGYLLAVEKAKRGTPYNIGHGYGITIENIIKVAAKINGLDDVQIKIDEGRARPAEVGILICDYTKAKNDFGYESRTPITVSIQRAIDYFKANPELLDVERN